MMAAKSGLVVSLTPITNVQQHPPREEYNHYITCYLGNTTAEVRDEQHSCMLPRQWGCIYSPHRLFAALQNHSMWKMRGLAYMCYTVG